MGATLLAVRIWPAEDYSRLTLEHDGPLKFSHFMVRDSSPVRLVVDVEEFRGGAKVAKALESANIIVNKNLLPWDSDPVRPSGIRLGSQEVTRLGMKEKDMDSVAELIARVAKGEDPSRVKDDATRLKSGFTKVHYCFFEGEEAYDYPSYDGDL